MSTPMTLENLPPTPFELEQQRHTMTLAQNELRERLRLRQANQAKGFPEPKPGDVLYVQLDGSVSRRTRAGIRFEKGVQIEVKIVDDARVAELRASGRIVASVAGAERIIEDSSLHVYRQSMSADDIDALRRKHAAVEEELKATRSERDALQAALRTARMEAKDAGDGKPSRLAAAAKVRATAEATPSGDFGAPLEPAKDAK